MLKPCMYVQGVREKVQKFGTPAEEGRGKVRKYGVDGEGNATGGGGGGDPGTLPAHTASAGASKAHRAETGDCWQLEPPKWK